MSPADRCDRIIELIDRVLVEAKIATYPKPAPVPIPVAARRPKPSLS